MSEKELKEMRELDDIAEKAGGFVAPLVKHDVHYDYREISKYCRKKKIEPQDLTIRELNKFVVS
ncbi:MAG: hypothetical protein RSC99_10680 [Clostridiales bacterium]